MSDTRGLYHKFIIRRTDLRDKPGEKHDGCDYFVLDLTHDPHALSVLMMYAILCRDDRPQLSHDIFDKYFVTGKALPKE